MSSAFVAAISVICMFGGALVGFWLQRRLPRHHLGKESQDLVRLGAGLIATVAALVLGLLISSAKGTFDVMNSRITQMSAKVLIVDELLAQYGPEARAVREQLRQSADLLLRRIWPAEATGSPGGTAVIEQGEELKLIRERLGALTPGDEAHKQLLAQAQQIMGEIAQSRWMLIEEAQETLPTALVVVLVFWLAMLFLSFGLFAPWNSTTFVALLVCACSMAGAIFLVLELSQPLDGFIKVSSGPLRKVLELMSR